MPYKNLNPLFLDMLPYFIEINAFTRLRNALDHFQPQACFSQFARRSLPRGLQVAKVRDQSLHPHRADAFDQVEADPEFFIVHKSFYRKGLH